MGLISDWKKGKELKNSTLPIKYLGGHPDLDISLNVFVGKDNENLLVYKDLIPGNIVITIPKTDIINCSLDRASSRSVGKAAVGAVVGGLLTGGIGVLAGAAIGGRKHDDSIIVLTVKYGNSNIDVFFGGDDVPKKYNQFVGYLR